MDNSHDIYKDFPFLIKAFARSLPFPRGLRSPLEEELTGPIALFELPSLEEFEELSILIIDFSSAATREKLSED